MDYIELNANSRNIANIDEVKNFIDELIKHEKEKLIINWVTKKLRKYIIDELPSIKPFRVYYGDDVDSFPDWLKKAIKEENAFTVVLKNKFVNSCVHILDYLNSLDEKELSKIYKINYPEMDNKAKLWTTKLKKETGEWDDFKGQKIVRKYKDGVKWLELFSQKCLDREGSLMNHCVSTYHADVRDKLAKIYSLRDVKNTPQCTIEVRDGGVNQIKGYDDQEIDLIFSKYVKDFLNNPIEGRKYGFAKELFNAYLKYEKGEYKINSDSTIKSGLFKGDLDLRGTNTKLPNKLHVRGDLLLSEYKLHFLPDNLTVDGTLDLSNSNIRHLPKKLKAAQLDLTNTIIEEIPDDLESKQIIFSKSRVSKLPDNFTTFNLFLGGSSIKSLPKNLVVTGTLNLEDSDIESIPEDIKLKGSLVLNYKIKFLPKSLRTINGSLNLGNNAIITLPDNLTVRHTFSGVSSKIKQLPDNLTVLGKMNFPSHVVKIGKNLKVKELEIGYYCKIEVIPSNITVKTLFINCDNVVKLQDNFTIEETLHINNCVNLTELPENLTVPNLIIRSDSISSLPINLKVEELDISGAPNIKKLPNDLQCNVIYVNSSNRLNFTSSKFKKKLKVL